MDILEKAFVIDPKKLSGDELNDVVGKMARMAFVRPTRKRAALFAVFYGTLGFFVWTLCTLTIPNQAVFWLYLVLSTLVLSRLDAGIVAGAFIEHCRRSGVPIPEPRKLGLFTAANIVILVLCSFVLLSCGIFLYVTHYNAEASRLIAWIYNLLSGK